MSCLQARRTADGPYTSPCASGWKIPPCLWVLGGCGVGLEVGRALLPHLTLHTLWCTSLGLTAVLRAPCGPHGWSFRGTLAGLFGAFGSVPQPFLACTALVQDASTWAHTPRLVYSHTGLSSQGFVHCGSVRAGDSGEVVVSRASPPVGVRASIPRSTPPMFGQDLARCHSYGLLDYCPHDLHLSVGGGQGMASTGLLAKGIDPLGHEPWSPTTCLSAPHAPRGLLP